MSCQHAHRDETGGPAAAITAAIRVRRCLPEAGGGHLELYKSTMKYDSDLGRGLHDLPPQKQLPL
jgi:hypothetical protein